MKDALGQEIKVGDTVLYCDVADGRVDFEQATIVRFTKVMVEVTYRQTKWQLGRTVKHLTSPSRIVLFPPPTTQADRL